MVDLSLVIPCYNEVDGMMALHSKLMPVVAELAVGRSVEVVFVDDGSQDGTGEALKRLYGSATQAGAAFKFECHPENRGLGAAIRTGFAAAQGEVVVTTDSDGTYPFGSIPLLLACLAPRVGLVTASPYHPAGGVRGVPAYRLVLSQGASFLYRLLVDRHVRTYTALFRAYRRQVINEIPFEANGFLAGTELMVKAMLAGWQVAEYPAVLHARVTGVSKARLARTIRAHLAFQWRVLLHRLNWAKLVRPHSESGGQSWTRPQLSSAGESRK
jgi:dolichol-phosphate mannosyltransferase